MAALMLGACSSNDEVVDNGSSTVTGDGYISINLNLPTTSSTTSRADDEGKDPGVQFKDGTAKEYEVKDATLIIFNGASETAATALKAYSLDISTWSNVDDNPNQVTTNGTVTQKIEVPSSDNIYAFVVLNHNGNIDITNQKIGDKNINGLTIADLQKLEITNGYETTNDTYFLMSNVPVSNTQGGNVTSLTSTSPIVKILADVDKEKIGKTVEEAKGKGDAAVIYVERALAKVTVSGTTSGSVSNATGITWSLDNWTLDVTNKQSYFSRNITSANLASWLPLISGQTEAKNQGYRFAGFETVWSASSEKYYRTYWGIDMNYNNKEVDVANSFKILKSGDAVSNEVGEDHPMYCFENTFDVDNQNQNQTTRVIAKVTLKEGDTPATFYALKGSTTKYDKANLIKYIKSVILQNKAVTDWYAENYTTGSLTESNITIKEDDIKRNDYGYITVSSYSVTGLGNPSTETALTTAYPVATLNKDMGNIACYEGGVAYYPVRIKHFGDLLTPWDNDEGVTITVSGYPTEGYTSTATRDGNYLGRYGVLRNNWYDIHVNNVVGFGYPEIPSVDPDDPNNPDKPGDTPDDEKASYIQCKINVLSWAKRTQSATLQ